MEKITECKLCRSCQVIHKKKGGLLGIKTQNMENLEKKGHIYRVIHGFIHIIHRLWGRG